MPILASIPVKPQNVDGGTTHPYSSYIVRISDNMTLYKLYLYYISIQTIITPNAHIYFSVCIGYNDAR